MSKFWNYFSTPKVAFLVLVWAAAALQLFVNMGIQKEDKIIDVLSRGEPSLLEGEITMADFATRRTQALDACEKSLMAWKTELLRFRLHYFNA